MRVRRTESGEITYFLGDPRDFNGFNDILGEFNATGVLKAWYVHGPGIDQPMAKFSKDEVPQGAWYYYHVDGRGSVTMLTRPDQAIANRYVYDDFGRFRSKTEGISNAYGFTGRETDVLGLLYYRARYYDPDVGRFLTRDPAGMADGTNLYAYVGNNPVNRVDPSGRLPPRRAESGRGMVTEAILAPIFIGFTVDGVQRFGCWDIDLDCYGQILWDIGWAVVFVIGCVTVPSHVLCTVMVLFGLPWLGKLTECWSRGAGPGDSWACVFGCDPCRGHWFTY